MSKRQEEIIIWGIQRRNTFLKVSYNTMKYQLMIPSKLTLAYNPVARDVCYHLAYGMLRAGTSRRQPGSSCRGGWSILQMGKAEQRREARGPVDTVTAEDTGRKPGCCWPPAQGFFLTYLLLRCCGHQCTI